MTRFARSKGSKASNDRAPEDSTPWAVMKEQLTRAKQDAEHARLREQAEKQRLENYENFLNERKTAKRKSTWCEFPPDNPVCASVQPANQNTKPDHGSQNEAAARPSKKNKNKTSHKSIDNNESENANHNTVVENTVETGVPKKKKKKSKNQDLEEPQNVDTAHTSTTSDQKLTKKKKKKSKLNNTEIDETHNTSHSSHPTEESRSVQDGSNKKNPNKNSSDVSNVQFTQAAASIKQKKKKTKLEHARRKPENERSFQIIINGREVELVRYDGFPVMRRDAERLEELKQSMFTKGIPKSEVQRTMKLERRRAEKALARLKRDVCYNCRKGGHNLSDCPDLKTHLGVVEGAADGVCFKCGSTEHRQFECRVQRTQEFRFASCFICKEQGHIARQCPDNPKGLYPNGGGCKLCGDVTHLRKDCPTTKSGKEEAAVRLDTLATADDVEGIAQPTTTAATATAIAADKIPKKIKF